MAEIVVSAFFTVFFEKLASEALNKLARSKGIDSELKKLKRSLIQIKALLNDAAQKEISDEAVKEWLNGLQHLAYDIDDVLDDLATEAMHRELTEESEGSTSMISEEEGRLKKDEEESKYETNILWISAYASPQLDKSTFKELYLKHLIYSRYFF
ncbi:hypothetical protein LXL04_023214 [Taraxacum kok-saghyz]